MAGSYVRKLREAEECGAVPDNSKVPFLHRYRAKRHAPLARSRTEVPVWRAGLALYGGRDTNMDVMMLPTVAHPALHAEPAPKNHQGPIGASALRRRKWSHRPCRPHRSSRCRLRRVRAAALETSCGICGATLFWYMAIGSVRFGSVRRPSERPETDCALASDANAAFFERSNQQVAPCHYVVSIYFPAYRGGRVSIMFPGECCLACCLA